MRKLWKSIGSTLLDMKQLGVNIKAMVFGMDKNGAKRTKVGIRIGKDQNGQAVLIVSSQNIENAEELMLQGCSIIRVFTTRFTLMEVPLTKIMNLQMYCYDYTWWTRRTKSNNN